MIYFVQDEWVVCRIFQKSSTVKKYPSNQPRPHHPFNLDVGPNMLPTVMQPDMCHFGNGRNYMSNADLAELSRVLRSPPNMNVPIQPQLNFPGSFTVSGLNLNLGAPAPPVMRSAPMMMNQQPPSADAPPGMLAAGMLPADNGLCSEMPPNENNRFQHMEPYVDFDGNYWPSY